MSEFYTEEPDPLPAKEHLYLSRQPASQETVRRIVDTVKWLTAEGAVQHKTNKSKSLLDADGDFLTVRSYELHEGGKLSADIAADLRADDRSVGVTRRRSTGEEGRVDEYSVKRLGGAGLQLVQHFYPDADAEWTEVLSESDAQSLEASLSQLALRDRSK